MSSLVFRITGDPSAFKAAMGEVSGSLDGVGRKAEELSGKLGSLGTKLSLGITAPVLALGASVVKTATDMDSLKRGLTAVAGSSEEAEKQLKRLQEVAKLPGLGFRDAVEGSIRLQAAGFNAALAERSLKAFGNALATVGKGKAELDGVTLALSQIASKGKISAEEINQLAERVPQIRQLMKAAFGTADTEVLQKAGIQWEEFITRIVTQAEKLKQVKGGPKNAFENFSDAVQRSATRIGDHLLPSIEKLLPRLEKLVGVAADAVDGFTKLPAPIQEAAIAIGVLALAAGPVSKLAAAFMELRTAIIAVSTAGALSGLAKGGAAAADPFIRKTTEAMQKLAPAAVSAAGGVSAVGAAAAAAGGLAVGGFLNFLNTSPTALENQKKASDSAADGMKRLNERYQSVSAMGQWIKETVKTTAAMKNNAASARDVTKELASVARATNTIKVDSIAETKLEKLNRVFDAGGMSVQEYRRQFVDLVAVQEDGKRKADQLSETSLTYVEMQERVKAAVGKVKDVMYEYATAGTVLGKKLDLVTASTNALNFSAEEAVMAFKALNADIRDVNGFSHYSDRLNAIKLEYDAGLTSAGEYAESLRRIGFELDNLASMPAIKTAIPKPGAFAASGIMGTNNAAAAMGFESDSQRQQRLAAMQKNLDFIREQARIGMATGTDVAKAQEAYNKAIDEGTGKTRKQSAAMKQVSTIATDLSRSLANAFVGLFDRPKVDVTSYQEKLADLRKDEEKLIAAQQKGQNVTAALAEVHQKMAVVSNQMGEAIKKSSFGFRLLEAGKSVIADLSKSIIRLLIEGALKRLGESLLRIGTTSNGVFSGIAAGLSKLFAAKTATSLGMEASLNTLFGTGAKAGSVIFSNAAGGGISGMLGEAGKTGSSAASSAGSSVASAAGNSISSMIGAAAGIGNLISGIVGNFQMKGMNKTLDLLEKSARYTEAYTLSILEKTNEFLPKLADIHQRLIEFRQLGIKLEAGGSLAFAGGGGDQFYFDFSGANLNGQSQQTIEKMLEAAVVRMKQKGLTK